MNESEIQELQDQIENASDFVRALRKEVGRFVVGQDHLVSRMLIGLLANGHILVEGVPGLAKTLAIKTLAQSIGCDFSRIQFTPDLLPADVVGTSIYNQQEHTCTEKENTVYARMARALLRPRHNDVALQE